MEERLKRLSNKCLLLVDEKVFYNKDLYKEIVNLIIDGDFECEKKLNLLVELYRYGFYNSVRTSLDLRGDANFKTSFLIDIKESLINNQVDDELIERSSKMNYMFQSYIDHPIDFIDKEINFYSQYPYTKF